MEQWCSQGSGMGGGTWTFSGNSLQRATKCLFSYILLANLLKFLNKFVQTPQQNLARIGGLAPVAMPMNEL